MTTHWTNEQLDTLRAVGDDVADATVDDLFANHGIDAVNQLMRTLVVNDGLPATELPPVVTDYLAKTAHMPDMDSEKVRLGEEVFGVLGPEILLILGFYSLPADYAAKKGVQVLYRTGRLITTPIRRVFETTQMVVDVMSPGGLSAKGNGVRSAQKVRLMHAAVRHLLTHHEQHPWDPDLGKPINQEDMAGTLMSFSYLVLDGLSRLGVELTEKDQDAYFHAWMVIGRLMGIREELIPDNLAQSKELTALIHQRQIAESPEGRALATALIEAYEQLLPSPLKGVPVSLTRFFLDHDPLTGQNIADLLGLPPSDWTRHVADLLVDVDHFLGVRKIETSLADKAVSYVSRHLIEGMLLLERGGKRAPFTIPETLQTRWGVNRDK